MRAAALLIALYLCFDCSMPFLPGVFELEDSIEAAADIGRADGPVPSPRTQHLPALAATLRAPAPGGVGPGVPIVERVLLFRASHLSRPPSFDDH